MIDIQSLSYSYVEGCYVFENLYAHIKRGEFWGVLGRNGAGKSTFLDLVLGLKQPSVGSIIFSDKRNIAFLSQDILIKTDISVTNFFEFHSAFFPEYSATIEEELLDYFDIKKESIIASLSTGQQKLVMAIACLSSMSQILVIDEITAVLDPVARHKFFAKLEEFNSKYSLTIILATNISEDLKDRVTKILYIEESRSQVLEPSQLSGIFSL
jgi:ABC-2 type transport system ATP-binding protein